LDINDHLSASEAGLQPSVLLAQSVKFVSEQLAWGDLGAAALRACKLALVTKFAPLGDVGGIDALAPEKCAALRGATWRRLIGLKDTEFLGSTASAALRGRLDLRRARMRGAWSKAIAG
jgi:hypothetical protein